jgi:hypothetical protein
MIPGPSEAEVPIGVPGFRVPVPGIFGVPGAGAGCPGVEGLAGSPGGGCTLPAVIPRSKWFEKEFQIKFFHNHVKISYKDLFPRFLLLKGRLHTRGLILQRLAYIKTDKD